MELNYDKCYDGQQSEGNCNTKVHSCWSAHTFSSVHKNLAFHAHFQLFILIFKVCIGCPNVICTTRDFLLLLEGTDCLLCIIMYYNLVEVQPINILIFESQVFVQDLNLVYALETKLLFKVNTQFNNVWRKVTAINNVDTWFKIVF